MKLRGLTAKFRPWTEAEHAVIREQYLSAGAANVAKQLGRTRCSVMHKAAILGVQSHRRWTPSDDKQLRLSWGSMPLAGLARLLNRSQVTTYWRARHLGLECGATQGFAYLTVEAHRTGFDTSQLRRILRWAGVKISRTPSRPTKSRTGRRFHMVDPCEVDAALERWHKTEPIETAARARGLTGDTLQRWLIEAGVDLGVIHKGYARHSNSRVESTVIDRVVAERQKLRTLASEARRVDVNRTTLRKWLMDAGVPRSKRNWFVEPTDVDRVVAERRGKVAA